MPTVVRTPRWPTFVVSPRLPIESEGNPLLDLFAEFKTHIDLLNAIRFQDPLARSNRWPVNRVGILRYPDDCQDSLDAISLKLILQRKFSVRGFAHPIFLSPNF